MMHTYFTPENKKGKHLSPEERGKIEAWFNDGVSRREIARRLERSHATINNEIKQRSFD
ncbi:MAG: helix-turn-helix domain-containing protein [Streptococcaceae bacterium]|jgi:IS30 family transposase|nr:helix-turn-helix domain-containing protein [Streptococcaceae bacterium]